jgi:two-component system, cell cycle sensor histidine kinase and response regulator CckA
MSEPLVLVVDDEEQIAQCATMFLKRAGYRTLQATSGEQALQMFNDEVDVLLTDCTMPGLPGHKLAALLLERKPMLRALFMSGNVAESILSDIPLEPGVNFIQKPFSSEQLVAFVIQAFVEKPVATH